MYELTNQRAVRKAFFDENPQASRRKIRDYSGKGRMYDTDTRVAFVDWLDACQRDGRISNALANRATLD